MTSMNYAMNPGKQPQRSDIRTQAFEKISSYSPALLLVEQKTVEQIGLGFIRNVQIHANLAALR